MIALKSRILDSRLSLKDYTIVTTQGEMGRVEGECGGKKGNGGKNPYTYKIISRKLITIKT